MSKIIKFTKKNIKKITSGYYWLTNVGFDDKGADRVIYRPVEVIVVEEAFGRYVSGSQHQVWVSAGTYIMMIGSTDWNHITYVLDFTNASLTPAKPPKGF